MHARMYFRNVNSFSDCEEVSLDDSLISNMNAKSMTQASMMKFARKLVSDSTSKLALNDFSTLTLWYAKEKWAWNFVAKAFRAT